MKFENSGPYKLNWGSITADGYNAVMNEMTFIFNFNLEDERNVFNVMQYVIGRLCYGVMNFPTNCVIKLVFDIRGQGIIVSKSKKFKERLWEKISYLDIPNTITIEFFR